MSSSAVRWHFDAARRRVRSSAWPAAQAAVAAAVAWWITHGLLGHQQPFFAPIAAAIAISVSRTQRARRALQMLAGVLLGIGVAVALEALLGTSTVALGAIVFATMIVALAAGAGFIGEGMMFANQAAASAILVIALHRHGTGAERALDAVVGAGVAVVIGVGLFPAHPMAMLHSAESDVLRTLADSVRDVLQSLRDQRARGADWMLARTAEIHSKLAKLDQSRRAARAVTTVAPRRRHMRAQVAGADARAAQMDLLANTVLSLIRAAVPAAASAGRLSAHLDHQLTQLWTTLDELAETQRPWPQHTVDEVSELARSILEDTAAGREFPVVTSILEATARDLLRVVG